MGIQISEDKFSPRAKAALRNAKNKSQFLRDAVEYYVGKDIGSSANIVSLTNNDIPDIKSDISEIKELLNRIYVSGMEVAAAQDNSNGLKNKVIDNKVNTSSNTTMEKTNSSGPKTLEIMDKPINNDLSVKDTDTDERIKNAERLLDDSIDIIFKT